MQSQQGRRGSITIYFGPKPPEGKEKNWIPTNPGEGWFSYFRLYGPLEAYFDRSWVLPDIEKASWNQDPLTNGCNQRQGDGTAYVLRLRVPLPEFCEDLIPFLFVLSLFRISHHCGRPRIEFAGQLNQIRGKVK